MGMVGIDIEDVERFKNISESVMNRVYTKREIEYCKAKAKPETHFAGMWCAKEAVVKCLNDLKLPVTEIEILHKANGAPYVEISSKLQKYFKENDIKAIDISISHTDNYATAIAIQK